jgi:hypothetical protein
MDPTDWGMIPAPTSSPVSSVRRFLLRIRKELNGLKQTVSGGVTSPAAQVARRFLPGLTTTADPI